MSDINFNPSNQCIIQREAIPTAFSSQKTKKINFNQTVKILSIASGILLTGLAGYMTYRFKFAKKENNDNVPSKIWCTHVKELKELNAEDFERFFPGKDIKNIDANQEGFICKYNQGEVFFKQDPIEGEALIKRKGSIQEGVFKNGTLVKGTFVEGGIKATGKFILNRHDHTVLDDENGTLEFSDGIKVQGEFKVTHFIKENKQAVHSNEFLKGDLILSTGEKIPLTKEILRAHKYSDESSLKKEYSDAIKKVLAESKNSRYFF